MILMMLTMILTVSCTKDEEPETSCLNSKLEEFEMVEYTNQELECKSFLELFHYKNEEYFLLGNHCLDMISYPVDCDGNRLCEEEDESFKCDRFYDKAESMGIVGIEDSF